jgi:hypothetical protein
VPILGLVAGAVLAFLVALLPERVKADPRFQPYSLRGAHITSAVVELFACGVLFATGLVGYMTSYTESLARRLTAAPMDQAQMAGVTLFGFVTYLTTPRGWICGYGIAEGFVRVITSVLTEARTGIGPLWLAFKVMDRLGSSMDRRELEQKLGPERPDEVVPASESGSGMLEIFSRNRKEWSDRQALEYRQVFYMLASRALVRRGAHHVHLYRFRPMKPGEIVRGTVVYYVETAPVAAVVAEGTRPQR